ncbi:MAG: DNA-primase RepB domain-containing protein [Verrucomicrobiota bacterium]
MDRLAEAKRMVDAFTRVGADRFDLTHTHLSGERRGFRRSQTPAQIHTSLPYLLDSAPRRQNNIILRPHSSSARLIQLDDLSADVMETVKPLSFLTLATSPGSYQAWIAVEDADADFVRRLRKGTGADISASGAVRLAGSHNFKPKYAPTFPVVTIEQAQPGQITTKAQLEALSIVAAPEKSKRPPPASRVRFEVSGPRSWPSYERCLQGAPMNQSGDKPDISRADFTFAMTAIDWGFSIEDTAARLLTLSAKAKQNGESYALTTAENAAQAVNRRHSHQGRA